MFEDKSWFPLWQVKYNNLASLLARQTLVIDGMAGALDNDSGGGECGTSRGRGRRIKEGGGRGSSRTSEAALHKGVAQQGLCRRPPLLLHKHLPQEVPAGVGHALGQRGLCGLRGDLEDGRHGFVLGPRRLLGQHFHHSAGHTPADTQGSHEDLMSVKNDQTLSLFSVSWFESLNCVRL